MGETCQQADADRLDSFRAIAAVQSGREMEQTAELIGVEVGAPLIWLEDVIEDENGQPRALSQLRLRGDRVAFSANARRSA